MMGYDPGARNRSDSIRGKMQSRLLREALDGGGSCAIYATERQITTSRSPLCNAIFRLGLGGCLKVLLCCRRWLRLAEKSGFSGIDDLYGCRMFAMSLRYLGKAPLRTGHRV